MKTKISIALCCVVLAVGLAGCLQTPAPLPEAPTPIATLIPATMPPPAQTQNQAEVLGLTLPAGAPDAPAGQAIFDAKCASCHGADGKGKVPNSRDFTDVDYVRNASPVMFFQAITDGKGDMPPFKDELSDDERWNLTYFLWSFSVPAAELEAGKTVFASAGCVACHGENGQGAIPQAAKFSPEFVAQHPAAQYYQSVSAGKGIMPAHQDRLSTPERWAAVEYARSFGYQPASK